MMMKDTLTNAWLWSLINGGGLPPPRYLVGDRVELLNGAGVGEVERVLGTGVVERIETADDGRVSYRVTGSDVAHAARTLRLIERGR